MKKRGLSMLIAVFMLVALLPLPASAAASGKCGENVTWSLDDSGTLTISGTGAMYEYSNDNRSPFYSNLDIKNVVIQDGVTSIGGYAFSFCEEIKSVIMADSVTVIGTYAFRFCFALDTVTMSKGMTEICTAAFSFCESLSDIYYDGTEEEWNEITIGSGNPYLNSATIHAVVPPQGPPVVVKNGTCGKNVTWTLDDRGTLSISGTGEMYDYIFPEDSPFCSIGRSVKTIVIQDGVTSIGDFVFAGLDYATSVVIPDSVTSIGESAFDNCISLTTLKIPDSVTSIGQSAFYGCYGLTTLKISDSVTNIEEFTFYGCFGLTSLTIGNKVTDIGDYAFRGCYGLTTVTIPDSVISIGYSAFQYCSGLTSVKFGSGVTTIGSYAFQYCSDLVSVTIPDKVTTIFDGVFEGCTGLTSVTIPSSVTSIGDSAFGGCYGLTSITIPDSVTSIGAYAFHNCTDLVSVTIPDKMTGLSSGMFEGCTGLTSVTIPSSVTVIYDGAFDTCYSIETVYFKGTEEQWNKVRIYDNEYLVDAMIVFEDGVAARASLSGGQIVINVKAGSKISSDDRIFVAIYSDKGRMLGCADISVADAYTGEDAKFTDNAEASYAKVFLWKSLSSQTPSIAAEYVEITR